MEGAHRQMKGGLQIREGVGVGPPPHFCLSVAVRWLRIRPLCLEALLVEVPLVQAEATLAVRACVQLLALQNTGEVGKLTL